MSGKAKTLSERECDNTHKKPAWAKRRQQARNAGQIQTHVAEDTALMVRSQTLLRESDIVIDSYAHYALLTSNAEGVSTMQ